MAAKKSGRTGEHAPVRPHSEIPAKPTDTNAGGLDVTRRHFKRKYFQKKRILQ
jgi:hypothetical protein